MKFAPHCDVCNEAIVGVSLYRTVCILIDAQCLIIARFESEIYLFLNWYQGRRKLYKLGGGGGGGGGGGRGGGGGGGRSIPRGATSSDMEFLESPSTLSLGRFVNYFMISYGLLLLIGRSTQILDKIQLQAS
jgi:hypothetical protein